MTLVAPRWATLALVAGLAAFALLGGACRGDEAPAATEESTLPPPSERFRSPSMLESYRWSLTVEATGDLLDVGEAPEDLELDDAILYLDIQGERVNPDREHTTSTITFGYISSERETIVIDGRLWSRQGSGAWRERATLASPEDFIGQDVGLSPAVILGDDDPETLQRVTDDLMARPYDIQQLDGRDVWHWELGPEWAEMTFGEGLNPLPGRIDPSTYDIEVWTDMETGVAVRMRVTGGSTSDPDAFRLEMALFDLDDPTIEIEEPPAAIGR